MEDENGFDRCLRKVDVLEESHMSSFAHEQSWVYWHLRTREFRIRKFV